MAYSYHYPGPSTSQFKPSSEFLALSEHKLNSQFGSAPSPELNSELPVQFRFQPGSGWFKLNFGITTTTTIANCIKGRKPMSVTHENQQLLSNRQKAALIDWCRWRGDIADPLSCAKLSALVNDLAGQCSKRKVRS